MLLFGLISLVLIALAIGIPAFFVIQKKGGQKTVSVLKLIGELLLLLALPLFGFMESNEPCQEHPFELNSYPTSLALYFVPLISYFVSAYFKQYLSPGFLAILPIGLVTGLIYTLVLQIHFANNLVLLLFPVAGLPLIAPLIAFLFLLAEYISLHKYQQRLFSKNTYTSQTLATMSGLFTLPFWQKTPIVVILCAPLLALMQFLLTLSGQAPDSMISMFTESCGFLLSNHHGCGCGGDHYLCSIAANGNKKLVKPVRLGLRQNEKILVNRQLLIANAFENWLEEKTPRLHKVIRKTYDSMGINVNKWSKKRKMANIIYVLMKPLEWFFLLWLYAFDKKPENRIAIQYLPEKMYETFKTTYNGNPTLKNN